ncbi:MAG TPA: DUF420 domain-containing protein [Pirellulales bacterium]|jgi:uncharacterized membrane protein YozB (DUF420 family)|nr:DUF420 domain-containing protein [Pirellulales bacterium]
MDFPGLNGFLGSRASLMLDIVFLAMFAVIPVMSWSIWLVRERRNYQLHKRVQLTLGAVLLVAVALFEIDMRVTGWTARAAPSPYYDTWVYPSLCVHLFFAVPTALVWIYVIAEAVRKFPDPPQPGEHSRAHRFWGWFAAIEMTLTAATGWVFYILAFVA